MNILTDWVCWEDRKPTIAGTYLAKDYHGEYFFFYDPDNDEASAYKKDSDYWNDFVSWRGLAFNPEAIEWTWCEDANGKDAQGWFIPPEGLAYKKGEME